MRRARLRRRAAARRSSAPRPRPTTSQVPAGTLTSVHRRRRRRAGRCRSTPSRCGRRRSRKGEFRRFVAGRARMAARPRPAAPSPTPAICTTGAAPTVVGEPAAEDQPVVNVSWFAAAGVLRRRGRAAADLGRMGIRRRRRRDPARRARRPGLAGAHPRLVRRPRRAPRCRQSAATPTSTAFATSTAWSGNGSTTSTRCSSTPTAAQATIPTSSSSAAPARSTCRTARTTRS